MRRLFLMVICAACTLAMCERAATQTQDATPPSADYILALRTANSFLSAWALRDADAGVALISRAILRMGDAGQGPDVAELRQFVTGLSNPRHQAFSIGTGTQQHPDRYAFPVCLFELYSKADQGYSWSDTLGVVLEEGEWRVDRLPRVGDGALR